MQSDPCSCQPAKPAIPIAVVGVSALFPGSFDTRSFWRDIAAGADRLSDVPRTHWLPEDYFAPKPRTADKVYTTRGGFLPQVDFSPLEFGLPPNTLPATDSAQLLGLVVAKRVLAEATRGKFESIDRSRMSVVLGVASATSLVGQMAGRLQLPVAERAMRTAGLEEADIKRVSEVLASCYTPWQESTFPGLLGNVVAGRIANRLDLGGTSAVVDAACASSLAAVDIAVNELALGRSDLVVTGGVDTLNDILMFMCFAQTGALSLSGDCRPFSDEADGTMLGEGVGMVALKRLSDAEEAGDSIYAVIRGIGSSSDGRGNSIYAPLPAGQALAMRRAYECAGFSADTVELVEAHGTATKAGDVAEFESMRTVFEDAGAARQSCAIGSVKAQIGHTKAAAGAAGLIKTVLALHHRVLPPTIKVRAPNPSLKIEDSPFYLNTELRPWVRRNDHPRRAAVSAFGFGGTNFHVALEEYSGESPRPERLRTTPSELVLFSGTDATMIAAACRTAARACVEPGALVHLARRSQLAFDPAAVSRLAIVAGDERDLSAKLLTAASSLEGANVVAFASANGLHFAAGTAIGAVAFLFPGQGSQYVGMGCDLAVHFDAARTLWDQAGESAAHVFPVPAFTDEQRAERELRLTATESAQPAIMATSLSMLRILERLGLSPACVGGHSLGEVTALAAAGAIAEADVFCVARARGELMAQASRETQGAMTAVVADRETVERLLDGWRLPVVVANHNAPRQVVLSGSTPAIEEVERRLRGEKLTARRLPVATAFHSPIVDGACAPFRAALDKVELHAPRIPAYSNTTAQPYPADATAIREQLAGAIACPVRFVDQIEAMYAAGVRVFLEVGPDSVLTKLIGRCLQGRAHLAVALDQRGMNGVTGLWDALGRLSVAGVPLKLAALWEGEALPEDPATRTTAKMSVKLTGTTYGKPYPPPSGELPLPPSMPHFRARSVPTVPAAYAELAPAVTPTTPAAASLQALQAPAIAAQMEFQRLMTESHLAFLRAVEASYAAFGKSTEGRSLAAPFVMPTASLSAAVATTFAPTPVSPPLCVAPQASQAVDLVPLMLAVVAEKTGYPPEMIDMKMDLETDLGIDSIKRVEILSAVRERAPGLPEVGTAKMGTLRTLADIVAFMAGDATSVDAGAAQITPTVEAERFAVRAIPTPAAGLGTPGLFGAGPVTLTPDGGGVAEAVAERLRARGIVVVVAAEVPAESRALIFLGGLDSIRSVDDALVINRRAFVNARAVAKRLAEQGGAFVTVQDTGGDFGLTGRCADRAWLAGLAALAKTAGREWPMAFTRAIDLERGDRDAGALADVLVDELLEGGLEPEVGLRADGARIVVATSPTPVELARHVVEKGAVFVVSGGARGVTAPALLELARAVDLRFVLLGRTPLIDEPTEFHGVTGDAALKGAAFAAAARLSEPTTPKEIARRVDLVVANREIRETLRALAAAGSEARYATVDVRDPVALVPLLDEIRRSWGPIRGLVHGAGVLSDASIENKTDDQFDRVFDTKVLGLRGLLAATSADPLEWICCFSSVAARAGNAGQADYAMANEILNKVAAVEARRRGAPCRVVSIGWGPWEGGMVTPVLRKMFEQRGLRLLSATAGAVAFARELSGFGDAEVLIAGDASVLVPPRVPAREADVFVDRATYPQLASHRIQGRVVLPVVMALEWFARLIAPLVGDRTAVQFSELRVVRGVSLKGYDGAGDHFKIVAKVLEDGRNYALTLCDAAGATRYAVTLDLASPPATVAPFTEPVLIPEPGDMDTFYGPTALFHGPDFQVLRGIDGLSSDGATAAVAGTSDMGWPTGEWNTDPAALDGALQLAFLFGLRGGNGPSLPMRIGRVVHHRRKGSGPLRCELSRRDRSKDRSIYNLSLTSADGRNIADLIGVEMFAVPSGTTAD
jgi:acyl transferase domain-containing protein